MTRCERQKLSQYLDGELPFPDAVSVRRHLAQCQRCQDEMKSLREVNQALAAWGAQQLPVPPRTDVRVRQSWERSHALSPVLSWAKMMPAAVGTSAAALLLLVTANIGSFLHTQQPTAPSVAAVENIRGLARQSRPLLLARRASAIQDGHALAILIQQHNKTQFDES